MPTRHELNTNDKNKKIKHNELDTMMNNNNNNNGGGIEGDNEESGVVGEGGGISCGAAVDLHALPEGCIANVISLTTPPDACRLSSVSTSFRSAAESDAVWVKFLPDEIPSILAHSSPNLPNCRSKSKEFYLALCDHPVLIHEGKLSFSLDKWTGKKCYMVSAKNLDIVWADTPNYWRWISQPETRFEEVAELVSVCWLEIRGKIDISLLSPSTMYNAYLVFKVTAGAYGFESQAAEVSVGLEGGEPTKQTVFLDAERGRTQRYQIVPRRVGGLFNRTRILGLQASPPREIDNGKYPKERTDGWLEVELGEFFCKGGEDGQLEMTCLETRGGQWKGGLIIQGIEVRPQRKC